MGPSTPSLLKRVLAIAILVLVAVVAIRLAVGLVSAVLWILVIVALVAAGLWARSTLQSGKRERSVKRRSSPEVVAAPPEDPVAVEMRRITEQLREQGRR